MRPTPRRGDGRLHEVNASSRTRPSAVKRATCLPERGLTQEASLVDGGAPSSTRSASTATQAPRPACSTRHILSSLRSDNEVANRESPDNAVSLAMVAHGLSRIKANSCWSAERRFALVSRGGSFSPALSTMGTLSSIVSFGASPVSSGSVFGTLTDSRCLKSKPRNIIPQREIPARRKSTERGRNGALRVYGYCESDRLLRNAIQRGLLSRAI